MTHEINIKILSFLFTWRHFLSSGSRLRVCLVLSIWCLEQPRDTRSLSYKSWMIRIWCNLSRTFTSLDNRRWLPADWEGNVTSSISKDFSYLGGTCLCTRLLWVLVGLQLCGTFQREQVEKSDEAWFSTFFALFFMIPCFLSFLVPSVSLIITMMCLTC